MSKTVYLGFYNDKDGNRIASPAGSTVIDYLLQVFAENEREILFISAAESKGDDLVAREEKTVSKKVKTVFLQSLKRKKGVIGRFIRRCRQKRILWQELIKAVDDGDTLIVYHSLYFINLVKKLQKKKKCKLILHVCEIYGDVSGEDKIKAKELAFIKQADAYICMSELLDRQINTEKKPSVFLYGTYAIERLNVDKFSDGHIHCVYAGTFDQRKGGALSAVRAGGFLDERYHIHILGFGNRKEEETLLQTMEEMKRISSCKITYDGLLLGGEYIRFLQQCHIGLSTQKTDARFCATSFPSKILSYLSNGLQVISANIPVLERSKINDVLYYYKDDTPQSIAQAIQGVQLSNASTSYERLQELHVEFSKDLQNLLAQLH